jgi:hypothetical protein
VAQVVITQAHGNEAKRRVRIGAGAQKIRRIGPRL